MTADPPSSDGHLEPSRAFLEGGGAAGALARSIDWARTPLGPVEAWPTSLRTMVGAVLHSRHPMFLWWGPELIQFYNDAYLPSFGVGKHPAAMGQRGRDCWQEIWHIIGPQIDDVLRHGKPSWNEDQLVPIFRNGVIEEVYWTYGYSPVYDEAGAVGGVLVVCSETTSRVLSERRLRTMRSLAESTASPTEPTAILRGTIEALRGATHDVSFAIIHCLDPISGAAQATESFGLDAQAVEALDPSFRRLLLPPAAGRVVQAGGRVATTSQRSGLIRLPAAAGLAPDARAYFASTTGSSGSHPTGFIVIGVSPKLPFDDSYRDHVQQITEHLALTFLRIQSLRMRAATERERERLLTEAQAASRAKDEFLAMLGHELRNPLSPIVTALQLMKMRGDGRTSKEVTIIERQVKHLVRLVDDLLDIAKITRGKVELQRETVEIADVVSKAMEIASVLFEQRRHRVSIDVVGEDLRLEGDPVRLAQVVANLLTNAARYTDPGGDIRLTAAREDHEIVICVKDSGAGISAEMLPRIFDVFFQGQRSSDRAEGGLGIGLTLVKTLVVMHGGTVAARSEGLGRGSEFIIRLPAPPPAAHPAPEETPSAAGAPQPPITRRRVLVVDDNEDAAELLGDILRAAGHDVIVVHDPPAALAIVAEFRPHVAVLDIGLPGMDGYELAERLRANTAMAGCRLIAATGYGQQHDRARSQAAGFQDHLVKPIDVATLIDMIARVCP
jgi:signal transduction histidine kinase